MNAVASDFSAPAPAAADTGLFVRNATGLVREVKPWQAMAINFITGAPPFVIAIALFGALAASVLIAAATAAGEPFGVLVPMLHFGFVGLWAARHGTFPPRRDVSTR